MGSTLLSPALLGLLSSPLSALAFTPTVFAIDLIAARPVNITSIINVFFVSKYGYINIAEVLDFSCPSSSLLIGQKSMRFGDHDRFPHPTSCSFFYMCLLSGFPRLGGCSDGMAFNSETGFCDQAENVPGWYIYTFQILKSQLQVIFWVLQRALERVG